MDGQPSSSEARSSKLVDVTQEQFNEGCNRRFGTTNPEKFDIPFWNAMVESGCWAWAARKRFVNKHEGSHNGADPEQDAPDGENDHVEKDSSTCVDEHDGSTGGEDAEQDTLDEETDFANEVSSMELADSGPIWCFDRIGSTKTTLPDGTIVHIAGEHEDFYDPDFLVYNDVVVFEPAASVDSGIKRDTPRFTIYGYPESGFPKTDFHTATYVPSLNAIVIVGNMSSPVQDDALIARGVTPIYVLKIGTWEIEKVEPRGHGPGVIFSHRAELKDGVLRVTVVDGEHDFERTKRKVIVDGQVEHVNIDHGEAWGLNLVDMTWSHGSSE